MKRIYLDNNATTYLDPRVATVFMHALQEWQGNPSSVHSAGREAKAVLNRARKTLADALGVKPAEIIFHSGATEGLNGLLRMLTGQGHLITSSAEHAAVYATAQALSAQGAQVTFLKPTSEGIVSPEAVAKALTPQTKLIALMAVNNETGMKTDLEALAALAQEKKIPLLVDGVAQLGKDPIVFYPGITAYCFSGHKIHGPKGIGFSYVRSTLKLDPWVTGGEQEFGKRGGTENLPAILGLAEAVRIALEELPSAVLKMTALRNQLEQGLLSYPGVFVNAQGARVCNTSNLSFKGQEGETLLAKLDLAGIAVSHGSACSSGALEPSRVLLEMGLPPSIAATALRFSLSRFTTADEIDQTLKVFEQLFNPGGYTHTSDSA